MEEPFTSGPSVIPPLSEEQREQLAAVARKVLEVLDDAEDKLWDMKPEDLAEYLEAGLRKATEGLDALKQALPGNDDERHVLAQNYLEAVRSSGLAVNSGAGVFPAGPEAGARFSDADASAEETEMLLATKMLPPEQRAAFMEAMAASRAALRRGELPRSEEDVVKNLKVLVAAIEELKQVFESVDSEDLVQVAALSIEFGRYAASALREAVDTAVEMALPELRMRGPLEANDLQANDRIEELGEDGEPVPAQRRTGQEQTARGLGAAPGGVGESEEGVGGRGRRRRRRKVCGRVRLLWPPLRKNIQDNMMPTIMSATETAKGLSVKQVLLGALLPLWVFLSCFAAIWAIPCLVIDEGLQFLYNTYATKWAVTVRCEETLFALLAAGKAWLLVGKIWLKQTWRLVKRQIEHAQKRPGGMQQLAIDTACEAVKLAGKGLSAWVADPMMPWRVARGAAVSLWEQAQALREAQGGAA